MNNIPSSIRCGFIGLGSQGAPMARAIVTSGYSLTLWARRAESLAPFADTGAQIAHSVAELGANAAHVGICVLDDAGTRDICNQLIPTMAPGSLIVIHSTVHPDTCREIARQAAERGVTVIDAPVSGGGQAAAERTLTLMLGGSAASIAKATPVFETFAGLMLHLGDVGAGQLAKLVNNNLMAANLALAHSAIVDAGRLGIDQAAMLTLLRASSGRSYALDVYAQLPSPGAFGHGAALLEKDIGLLTEVLDSAGLENISGQTGSRFIDAVRADQA